MIRTSRLTEPQFLDFLRAHPVSGGTPGKSSNEKTAETNSATTFNQNQNLTNKAQGTLSQFEGPVQDSPFYKALKTTGIESTSNAYGNARSNLRQNANLSGFGYSQPATQGGEAELGAREASSLAAIPREAMVEATGPALEAARETGSLAGTQGQMSTGFSGQAADLEKQRQQNSLWNKMWSLPQAAAQGVGAYYGAGG
jgi:hypothetical protein